MGPTHAETERPGSFAALLHAAHRSHADSSGAGAITDPGTMFGVEMSGVADAAPSLFFERR
jgi:hypothetical protein